MSRLSIPSPGEDFEDLEKREQEDTQALWTSRRLLLVEILTNPSISEVLRSTPDNASLVLPKNYWLN